MNKFFLVSKLLVEISTIKKLIRSGKLSVNQIEDLKKRGMIKPEDEYLSGIEKGTEKLASNVGAKIYSSEKFPMPGATLPPSWTSKLKFLQKNPSLQKSMEKNIGIPKIDPDVKTVIGINPKTTKQILGSNSLPFVKRHEADEAQMMSKGATPTMITKKPKPEAPGVFKTLGIRRLANRVKNIKAGTVGSHANAPEVLNRERNLINYYNKAYGNEETPGIKKMRNIRKGFTGEYDLIAGKSKQGLRRMDRRGQRSGVLSTAIEPRTTLKPTKTQFDKASEYLKQAEEKWKKQGLSQKQIQAKMRLHRGSRQALATQLISKRYGTREKSRQKPQIDPTVISKTLKHIRRNKYPYVAAALGAAALGGGIYQYNKRKKKEKDTKTSSGKQEKK